MRVGMGYDVHQLVEGRDLILGGVNIPYEKGLLGHSDADVLLHAITDAILGAAALGDIGKHFPDTDPAYHNADSMKLLAEVVRLIEEKGYEIGNVDATVIAQRPKLLNYIPTMKENISKTLKVDPDQVNVKATTEERLGFTGREEGIAAQAICSLNSIYDGNSMEIVYQKNKDKQPVYDMYQEIFEDPEPFAQYYFEEIYATNQVMLAEEDNKILGMIHLNPYHIRAGKKTYTLNYIVAVAVWKEYRRRGIMAEMLKKCLNDMHEQQQPFTYLMPANKAYYEPFQFRFVMDWEETMIDDHNILYTDDTTDRNHKIVHIMAEDYQTIQNFLERFMEQYKIYTVPDEPYLRRLEKESQSGDGSLLAYYEDDLLQGVFAESFEEDEVYIRWAYSLEPEHMLNQIKQRHQGKKIYITEGNLFKENSTGKDFIQSKKVPKIMARITNLTAWGDILQGKNDFTFRILVKDPYIKDQNGVFQFQCLNHKISIQRADIPQDETLDIHTTEAQGWKDEISIDELTQVFFDYDAGQILKEHEYLKDIVPAGPIYISEEV